MVWRSIYEVTLWPVTRLMVAEILRVDLYGTSVLLEEFGKVIAEGGSGVIISSQSGHRLPALPQEQNDALATTPVDELLELPFLKEINDTLKAYQYSKRCNVLRLFRQVTIPKSDTLKPFAESTRFLKK